VGRPWPGWQPRATSIGLTITLPGWPQLLQYITKLLKKKAHREINGAHICMMYSSARFYLGKKRKNEKKRIACYQMQFSAHGEVNGELCIPGYLSGDRNVKVVSWRVFEYSCSGKLAPEREKINRIFFRAKLSFGGRMKSKKSCVRLACYQVQFPAHGEVNGELLCTGVSFGGPGCQSGVVKVRLTAGSQTAGGGWVRSTPPSCPLPQPGPSSQMEMLRTPPADARMRLEVHPSASSPP